MHALPTLQSVLSKQSEKCCPTIFSPLSYSVLPAFPHTPPFQGRAVASVSSSCAVVHLVFVQNLLPQSSPKACSNIIHLFLSHGSPLNHFFRVIPWFVLHFLSGLFFAFLLFFCIFHLGTHALPFCQTSTCKETKLLPVFVVQKSLAFLLFCVSICEQSKFCLTLCPVCALAFFSMPATTS